MIPNNAESVIKNADLCPTLAVNNESSEMYRISPSEWFPPKWVIVNSKTPCPYKRILPIR